jgi:hypothetical protein
MFRVMVSVGFWAKARVRAIANVRVRVVVSLGV